jgi:hypothetical protein
MRAMIRERDLKMTGDPIMEVMEGDAAAEGIPAAGIRAEGVAVTVVRAEKAMTSVRKCTNC